MTEEYFKETSAILQKISDEMREKDIPHFFSFFEPGEIGITIAFSSLREARTMMDKYVEGLAKAQAQEAKTPKP